MSRYFIEFASNGSFKNPPEKVYFVNKNNHITFVLDSQLLKNLKPLLLSNIPSTSQKKQKLFKCPRIKQKGIVTQEYLDLNYNYFTGFYNKELSWQCNVQMGEISGSMQFQIIFVDEKTEIVKGSKGNIDIKEFGKTEWLIVEPQLINQSTNQKIDKNQLIVQTVLPYQLGKSENWLKVLQESINLKYNAFHFPPLQELGRSGSLYSIRDQLKFNSDIFKNEQEVIDILKELNKKGVTNFTDILLNHTSCDSQWLVDCPGSYYNEKNTPHLYSAIVLDEEIYNFWQQIQKKAVQGYDKTTIDNEEDLQKLMGLLKTYLREHVKIIEFFKFNIEETKVNFIKELEKQNITLAKTEYDLEDADNFFAKSGIEIIEELVIANTQNIGAQRYSANINIENVIKVIKESPEKFSLEGFERALQFVDKYWQQKAEQYIQDAFSGLEGTIRWEHIEDPTRFQRDQSKLLVPRYFSKLQNGDYAANNGWIMNYSNIKESFVESDQFYYLRRSIVIWSDLVKLRYGRCKEDSKFLWKRMKTYVTKLATMFQGFRIDNAHSTPLHVGEYFIKKAREVNKDLVVFAELFSGSPAADALFVKRMGINALVRETIHAAEAEHIYGQLDYIVQNQEDNKYIGSLPPLYEFDVEKGQKMQVLISKIPQTIIYDQTHDNEAVVQQQNIGSMMSTFSLVSFSNIFYGTTKGFDELYPEKLSVVSERRKYSVNNKLNTIQQKVEKDGYNVGIVYRPDHYIDQEVKLYGSFNNWSEGITCVKEGDVYIARFKIYSIGTFFYKFTVGTVWTLDSHKQEQDGNHYFTLNVERKKLQYSNLCQVRLGINNICQEIQNDYPQISLKSNGQGVISIIREHQSKHQSYMMISRTAFKAQDSDFVNFQITCNGQLDCVKHIYVPQDLDKARQDFANDKEFITGYEAVVNEEYNIREYADVFYSPETKKQVLHFYNLKPGTVIILQCSLAHEEKQQIVSLNKAVTNTYNSDEIIQLFSKLTPTEINYFLFICDQEEWELHGQGMYHIPDHGSLIYSGIAGFFNIANQYSLTRNFRNPLTKNIKTGNWIIDHLVNRLKNSNKENLQKIGDYFGKIAEYLKIIPNFHKSYYFFLILKIMQEQIISKIYTNIQQNSVRDKFKSTFCKNLLVASYQFIGESPSNKFEPFTYSISAGLPHFSTGWSRAWGRDTFIAFRGLLLLTGLYSEAKQIILMFASTLRHGLIPNLLDGGKSSRFNNRDSCWWFIKAIKDYIQFTSDTSIWKSKVSMVFLDDSIDVHYKMKSENKKVEKHLYEIVQDIFQKHATGIRFREWRAGQDIDSNMKSEGFNIQLELDLNTGFIVGGNEHNCLTWMDKMGSSSKSGNQGVPATSRNGSPIELTALSKLCLDFVHQQNLGGDYPYKGVDLKNGETLNFSDWSKKIKENFQKNYWVQENPTDFYDKKYAYITGIYKDVVFGKEIKNSYQLRPNSCIAIAVAPELFDLEKAQSHVQKCEKYLLEEHSIGIKTLDILSDEYIPYYDNDDDSTQYQTSHGYSYHNGPEWVWVYAYFLQALIQVHKQNNTLQNKYQSIMSYLALHKHHLSQNEWQSLPEMTNNNGNYCKFSCPAQAWSIGCILEVNYDLQQK